MPNGNIAGSARQIARWNRHLARYLDDAADDTYGEWPKSGEMDIMENVGYELPKVHYAIHTEKYNHTKNNQKRHTVDCATVATDFHVYGFEWREDKLTWYLDGVKIYSVTKDENGWEAWPFDRPFYLILNFAFGGGWGGSQGVDLDALPQRVHYRLCEGVSLT